MRLLGWANIVEKKPTFFWQGALILLPLVLLLGFGVYSLRQDRAMAEIEAKERCQQIASDLLRPLATGWQEQSRLRERNFEIAIDSNRNLVSIAGSKSRAQTPRDPQPLALDLRALTPQQATLWQQARNAEFANVAATQRAMLYQQFLAANPPAMFVPLAKYSLALNLSKSPSGLSEKDRVFNELQTNSQAMSEAGLPLSLLAGMQRLQLAVETTNVALFTNVLPALCSNAVEHPSFASPVVLERAAKLEGLMTSSSTASVIASSWQNEWDRDEEARAFYAAVKPALRDRKMYPDGFWFNHDGSNLLVIVSANINMSMNVRPLMGEERRNIGSKSSATPVAEVHLQPAGTYRVESFAEADVRANVLEVEKQESARIPDYAEAAYQIGDRWIIGSPDKRSLGALSSSALEGGVVPVTVSVHVVRPNLLYARQRQRTGWFAGLLALSAGAACIGLVSAHRGFRQQIRLNEMKSNFVSSVSHELRAPIASVRLLAEALDRGAVSEQPKQKEYFRFIVQECRRLTGLIENVLDFSRIEQGRKNYEFEETDLNTLVEQTVKLMQPATTERGVTVELRIANCELPIVCDGLAVQQALVNLIDNAVKHSLAGQKVTVGIEEGERPTSNIKIWVEDQGPGIPAEEHERIFERFYRRGSELRRETQGIGIGLTIVKHVAEAHRGRVSVESTVGKGSRFTIELPHEPSATISED